MNYQLLHKHIHILSLKGCGIEVESPVKEATSGSPDRGVLAGAQGWLCAGLVTDSPYCC